MICLKNIVRDFRTEDLITRAVNDIELDVSEGDFVSIMGPSGCGKSSLLNILGLLDKPTSGSYKFADVEVAQLGEKALAKIRNENIGFIFQNFNLIDELTVRENIELPLLYRGVSASARDQRVKEVMEKISIDHRANHYPNQLSGGQQQRVAIARALVSNPKLILADEPTGNLDSKNGIQVMELLSKLNDEGTTIIMVTHSERDAEYGNVKILLSDGSVQNQENFSKKKVA